MRFGIHSHLKYVWVNILVNEPDILNKISIVYGASCQHISKLDAKLVRNDFTNVVTIVMIINLSSSHDVNDVQQWLSRATTTTGRVSQSGKNRIYKIDPDNMLARDIFDYLFNGGPRPDALFRA